MCVSILGSHLSRLVLKQTILSDCERCGSLWSACIQRREDRKVLGDPAVGGVCRACNVGQSFAPQPHYLRRVSTLISVLVLRTFWFYGTCMDSVLFETETRCTFRQKVQATQATQGTMTHVATHDAPSVSHPVGTPVYFSWDRGHVKFYLPSRVGNETLALQFCAADLTAIVWWGGSRHRCMKDAKWFRGVCRRRILRAGPKGLSGRMESG